MPKKNKKSRSTDPDLPDLETRKAYLLEIGMPSPYQGETTSSSSIDDSSSSPATNETEESNDNRARPKKADDSSTTSDQTIVRPERPADGASTSTHQSAIDEMLERHERAGDGESTSAHESFHDGRNIAMAERAGDVASTSVHKSIDEDKNNVNEAESLEVSVHSKDSEPESYSNTAITGEKSKVVAETQQTWKQETANQVDGSNITHRKDSEYLAYSSEKTYPKHEQPTKYTPEKTVIPTVTPRTITRIKRKPDQPSKGKSDKTVTPTKYTTETSSRIRTRSVTAATGSPVVSSQENNRPTTTKYTTEASSRIRTRSSTSAKGSSVVSSQEKNRPTTTKYTTEASSRIRTRSATSAKRSALVSAQEKTRAATSNKFTTEISSKEKRTTTSNKYTTEISSKEKRSATQTKYTTEVSSKIRTRSATSAKSSPVVSSQENVRTTTRTKYTGEVSSKEKRTTAQTKYKTEVSTEERTSKSVQGSPEVLQKTEEKTRTPIKYKSEAQLEEKAKIATPMKLTPNTSSQEKGEKTVTTTKYTPEIPSKEKIKSITPTKCTTGVLPEVRIRTATPTKHTPEASPQERSKKSITPTKHAPDVLSKESKKSVTTKHMPDVSSKGTQAETPMKSRPVASSRVKCEKTVTPTKCIPEASTKGGEIKSKIDNGRIEPNVISLKEFKEPFEVDRIQTRDINSDVFEKAVGVDKNSEDPPGQKPKPVISTEEFLGASASAVDKLELNRGVSNESKIETTVDPPTTTEPSVSLVTFEEFKRTLGTDKIPPRHDDDLDVFNKALEKMEARRRRRVMFSNPNEHTPSTSQVTPSPEKQLDNVSQNTKSALNINPNLSGSMLTFEEFHRGLCTFGMINPELLKFDVFDKALEDMEKANSSQLTEVARNISCKPEPVEESDEPHSSDEDMNRAIAASGLETKHFRVLSSDDETEITLKSATQKISRAFLSKLGECEQRAPVITDRIPEEDMYLSESTSKSSEASLEESSGKSSEHDLVSSESLVKSSESEASPVESIVKSPEQEVESSESAVKSTESEQRSEEFSGIHKELEVYDPERSSGFETSRCETKLSARKDSSESSEESELKSPKKRQRKSDRIVSVVEKSVGKKDRSRTQSEIDLRKRRPGDKDLIPSKKRYSDEH